MKTTPLTCTCKLLGEGVVGSLGWMHRSVTTGPFHKLQGLRRGLLHSLELAMQLKTALNSRPPCFFLPRAWEVFILKEVPKTFCRVALFLYTSTSDLRVTCHEACSEQEVGKGDTCARLSLSSTFVLPSLNPCPV